MEIISNRAIRNLRAEINSIKTSIAKEKAEFQKEIENVGFLDEIQALRALTRKKENGAMWWANLIIITLIVLIETAPILVKLISSRGPYDAQLDFMNQERMMHYDKRVKKIRFPRASE